MMDRGNNTTRPAVLDNASETQIEELQRQYDQQDREGWERLMESYGWSKEDGQAVWDWFGVQPDDQR